MIKKKLALLSTLVFGLTLVTACGGQSYDGPTATITITNEAKEGTVINPNDVTISETLHSLEEKKFYNTQVLPSTGDVNILVIPILIPGYTSFSYRTFEEGTTDEQKQEIVRNDIVTSFFGEAEETGWQSVKSFYHESSYGKLNLNGVVTDWFDASTLYDNANDITITETYNLVESAVQWAIANQGINPADYDYDNDGFIDGVWCIYSAEDYSKDGPYTDDQNYWAYTTWGNQDKEGNPSTNEYYYNLFGWASYDYMYEGYGLEGVDAHTYIHETGHFLGLNDYYSDRVSYNPLGKMDMMDANVIDHNSYSKMLLGWTKPYIVTGNATIELKDLTQENNFIVVLPDEATIKNNSFDPFSEYILVELYSNNGLNYQDSQIQISSDRPLASEEVGVRIYHVDNRKFLVTRDSFGAVSTKLYEGEELDGYNYTLINPITNSISPDQNYWNLGLDLEFYPYDEIRMIEASNDNTFSTGGYQTITSLFTEGTSFSLDTYGEEFFINQTTLNNGQHFSSTISITSIVGGNN